MPELDLFRLEPVAFDHPDADTLIEAVQDEYVRRYGGRDTTPHEVHDFAPPRGTSWSGTPRGRPVACGGWRDSPESRYLAKSTR